MQIIKITTKQNQTSSESLKKEALQAKYKNFKYLINRPINNITAAMTIYGSGYCNVIIVKDPKILSFLVFFDATKIHPDNWE